NEIKTINLRDWNFDPETESAMGALGFKPFTPEISNQLTNVSAQGAGERAGLQVGDTVLQINGQAVEAWQQVVNAIQSHP
ncbi:PDZ domain-containing protein, partial [Vibrio parahaemolyticus]